MLEENHQNLIAIRIINVSSEAMMLDTLKELVGRMPITPFIINPKKYQLLIQNGKQSSLPPLLVHSAWEKGVGDLFLDIVEDFKLNEDQSRYVYTRVVEQFRCICIFPSHRFLP